MISVEHGRSSTEKTTRDIYFTAKLFAVHHWFKDAAAFVAYYFKTHTLPAEAIPRLKGFEVSGGHAMGMSGKHGMYLVGTLNLSRRKQSAQK